MHKFPVGSEIISLGTKQVVGINMACFGSMKATTHHILLKRENMRDIHGVVTKLIIVSRKRHIRIRIHSMCYHYSNPNKNK